MCGRTIETSSLRARGGLGCLEASKQASKQAQVVSELEAARLPVAPRRPEGPARALSRGPPATAGACRQSVRQTPDADVRLYWLGASPRVSRGCDAVSKWFHRDAVTLPRKLAATTACYASCCSLAPYSTVPASHDKARRNPDVYISRSKGAIPVFAVSSVRVQQRAQRRATTLNLNRATNLERPSSDPGCRSPHLSYSHLLSPHVYQR